jgi:hypothetical protein
LKGAIDGAGQRLAKRGLADSWNALNQKMSAGKNADQRQPHNLVLAADYAAQGLFQIGGFMRYSDRGLRRHC